ncbi:MAG: thioredoxin domain-containing protein [Candidatus Aenigmarchaeota archaeon]|nr:thioredoxin domain-containing protein [Candidatus Aenigmarchaeota archaeon]
MAEETAAAEKQHTSRKEGAGLGKMFVVVFVAALLGTFLGGNAFSLTGNAVAPAAPAVAPSAPAPNPTPTAAGTIALAGLEDDDPVDGNPEAPVTIIEFSDFQCPFCGRFYLETLPGIQNYIADGRVRIIYRDFPLSFHPEAQPAAEAAECAKEQGKFWEFHDKVFENQGAISKSAYIQWAGELGMNVQQFTSCVETGKYRSEVQADFNAGSAAGVSGTPTFFVGPSGGQGVKIVGAQPFSTFQVAIDAALQAAA